MAFLLGTEKKIEGKKIVQALKNKKKRFRFTFHLRFKWI